MGENYFDILGVGRNADDDAVKQAFRELAKACHPDRNPGDAAAEQQFKRINTAYEALKDGHRREAYVEWLQFAETRERSKMAQWGRIGALVAVLIFGPVLLYLALMSSDLALPSGDQGQRPSAPPVVVAPTIPPAVTQQKQAAKQPIEGTQISPTPSPVTEASKTARTDAPAKNTPPENANRWQPAAETVPPMTTESLPQNQSTTAAPPTPFQSSALSSPNADGDALPETNSSSGSPPSIVSPAQEEPSGAENSGNFVDCSHCPQMVVTNDARASGARDHAGRSASREPVAISKGEITVSQWNACVAEGPCPRYVTASQVDAHRVVRDVSVRDAAVYADWLSRKTGQPYRVLADADNSNQRRDGYTDTTCATPGWEWLEDGCSRRTNTYSGFRVTRSVRTAAD